MFTTKAEYFNRMIFFTTLNIVTLRMYIYLTEEYEKVISHILSEQEESKVLFMPP